MATLAHMPENFSDSLGNWKSRAKNTYRRTTLVKAQSEFSALLGASTSQPQQPLLPEWKIMVKARLQRMFREVQIMPNIKQRRW